MFKNKSEAKRIAQRQKESQQEFDKRMKRIEDSCNDMMKTGEKPNGMKLKDNIVVPYDTILGIWNQANLTRMGFEVK